MKSKTEELYDQVPYPQLCHSHTRIDRLKAIGALYGLETPPCDSCRVLELGCGPGTNILAMACRWPGARFLGIDLSEVHVQQAQETAVELGLGNIEFRHQSITDPGPELGTFDYILAHGVYSWVPAEVRDRLLQICRQHLSASGLAYVSYNALPGWQTKTWLRDAMKCAETGPDSRAWIPQGRAFAEQVLKSQALDGPAKATFQQALQELDGQTEDYLLHDLLAENSQPFYFQEFVEHASRHRLHYLADAEDNYLLQAAQPVAAGAPPRLADPLRREQKSDFLRHRSFRKSLLCREEAHIDPEASEERLLDMWVLSFLRQDDSPGPLPAPGLTRFTTLNGNGRVFTGDPALKAALKQLQGRFPHAIPFRDLLRTLGLSESQAKEQGLGRSLLGVWKHGDLDLLVEDLPLPRQRGERSSINPIARHQARTTESLTNLAHSTVNVVGPFLRLVPFVDGTRTDLELAQKALEEGVIPRSPGAAPSGQLQEALAMIRSFLDWCLQHALLER